MLADWRYLDGLGESSPMRPFVDYFAYGMMDGKTVVNQRTNHNNLLNKDA